MKVLLVGSAGGHLAQLDRLRPWWSRHERMWVTFRLPDSESRLRHERVAWGYHPTTRNVPNMLRNLWLARRICAEFKPDLIVSMGAGVAFPFFLIGRLRGVRTVYLEVFDRIDSPTMTGRLCYWFTDLFLLQWQEQKRWYPRGVVVGSIL